MLDACYVMLDQFTHQASRSIAVTAYGILSDNAVKLRSQGGAQRAR